jgi:hypothetical protein
MEAVNGIRPSQSNEELFLSSKRSHCYRDEQVTNRVAQVSRLRPGILATDVDWQLQTPLVSLGAI